jgi:integrase/recombinase XerD
MPDYSPIRLLNPEIEEIANRLHTRYKTAGFSRHLFYTDRGLLRRVNKHPKDITHEDIEKILVDVPKQQTKALYRTRFKSMFNSFREMEIIDENYDPLKKVPKIKSPRTLPRPFTNSEVEILLSQADYPMRDMFTLSCYAGMRAMEIAQVRGVDLEEQTDGFYIRIPNGKGKTDLSVPAHPLVVEVIQKYKTLGELWNLRPNAISTLCNRESRRLGINKKLHSGRHFFATNAYATSGGDLLAVCKLMRHSSVATTQVYAQLGDSVTRNVVANLSTPTKIVK